MIKGRLQSSCKDLKGSTACRINELGVVVSNNYIRFVIIVGLVLVYTSLPCCPDLAAITYRKKNSDVLITVGDESIRRGGLNIGFNLGIVPFEKSFWNNNTKRIDEELLNKLKTMPGMIYRYPGGSVANRFEYTEAIGEKRKYQKLADWIDPYQVAFGPYEYMDFIRYVGGAAWLVLNVSDTVKNDVIDYKKINQLMLVLDDFIKKKPIKAIELGNELYLRKHMINGREYAKKIIPYIQIIQRKYPDVNIIVGLQGFDSGSVRANDFNEQVLSYLQNYETGYSLHYYFDGPPGGPPVDAAIRNIKKTINLIQKINVDKDPQIWITEYGRWPGGKVDSKGWSDLWPRAENHDAALSLANFVLSAVYIRNIKGFLIHSLGGVKGPWRMFKRNTSTGSMLETDIFHFQKLLTVMQGGDIKKIKILNNNSRENDIKAVVSVKGNEVNVIMINNGLRPLDVEINISQFMNKTVEYNKIELNNNYKIKSRESEVYNEAGNATFSQNGSTWIEAREKSILKISFNTP